MELFKKTYWIIFPLILLISLLILDKVFDVDNLFIRYLVPGLIAFILSPRRKVVKTQTGEKKQITWLFLKKPIIID